MGYDLGSVKRRLPTGLDGVKGLPGPTMLRDRVERRPISIRRTNGWAAPRPCYSLRNQAVHLHFFMNRRVCIVPSQNVILRKYTPGGKERTWRGGCS